MAIRIVPSILAADFTNLGAAVREAEDGGADAIQIDVMDGHFVPNLTIGIPVITALRQITTLPLDVHLMIENPEAYIDDYVDAGADILTVHAEVCPHLHRVVEQIKGREIKAGVALNPATPLVVLEEILQELDLVLLMTVNPGFGGQHFIMSTLSKIRRLREMLVRHGLEETAVEVDGGINEESTPRVAAAGADWLVAGSAVYGAQDGVASAIARLRHLAESAWRGEQQADDP